MNKNNLLEDMVSADSYVFGKQYPSYKYLDHYINDDTIPIILSIMQDPLLHADLAGSAVGRFFTDLQNRTIQNGPLTIEKLMSFIFMCFGVRAFTDTIFFQRIPKYFFLCTDDTDTTVVKQMYGEFLNLQDSGVNEIASYGFSGCPFTQIVLPKRCLILRANSFTNCPNLKSVKITGSNDTIILIATNAFDKDLLSHYDFKILIPQDKKSKVHLQKGIGNNITIDDIKSHIQLY